MLTDIEAAESQKGLITGCDPLQSIDFSFDADSVSPSEREKERLHTTLKNVDQ